MVGPADASFDETPEVFWFERSSERSGIACHDTVQRAVHERARARAEEFKAAIAVWERDIRAELLRCGIAPEAPVEGGAVAPAAAIPAAPAVAVLVMEAAAGGAPPSGAPTAAAAAAAAAVSTVGVAASADVAAAASTAMTAGTGDYTASRSAAGHEKEGEQEQQEGLQEGEEVFERKAKALAGTSTGRLALGMVKKIKGEVGNNKWRSLILSPGD